MALWAEKMGCDPEPTDYPTDMDGVIGWKCKQWTGCKSGIKIVHCTGYFSHNYPFFFRSPAYVEGTRILWNFVKTQKRPR